MAQKVTYLKNGTFGPTVLGAFFKWVYCLNLTKFATEVLSYLVRAHHFSKNLKLLIGKKVMAILLKGPFFLRVMTFTAVNVQ